MKCPDQQFVSKYLTKIPSNIGLLCSVTVNKNTTNVSFQKYRQNAVQAPFNRPIHVAAEYKTDIELAATKAQNNPWL